MNYLQIGINFLVGQNMKKYNLHVHLIPRRFCDIDNPKGGVRGVIPEKRGY